MSIRKAKERGDENDEYHTRCSRFEMLFDVWEPQQRVSPTSGAVT
jgi:hypothetical protein